MFLFTNIEKMSSLAKLTVLLSFIHMASSSGPRCGLKEYNRNTEICCNGKIHDLVQHSKIMGCCTQSGGGVLYPEEEKLCCGENLIPIKSAHRYQCCNRELINTTTEGCCGTENFGVKYDLREYKDCCIDMEKKDFKLHPLRERHTCCGTLYYDKSTSNCHFGNGTYSVEKMSPDVPCGSGQYDPAHSVCCNDTGTVEEKPDQRDVWMCRNNHVYDGNLYYYDADARKVLPKGVKICGNDTYVYANKDLKCCGTQLHRVDSSQWNSFVCCGSQIWNLDDTEHHCCASRLLDSSTYGCCNGEPFRKGYDRDCCGTHLLNRTTEICCPKQSNYFEVVKKQHLSDTDCCRSHLTEQIETYNKYEKDCIQGQVQYKGRELTKKLTTVQPTTWHSRRTCPFCLPKINRSVCNKTSVYKFFVYDERSTKQGTVLLGVILKPYQIRSGLNMNGEKIRIRTRNHCNCFKMRKNYYLFTNRKIKSIRENKFNIRFTSDDAFIPVDSKDYNMCFIYAELRKALG